MGLLPDPIHQFVDQQLHRAYDLATDLRYYTNITDPAAAGEDLRDALEEVARTLKIRLDDKYWDNFDDGYRGDEEHL